MTSYITSEELEWAKCAGDPVYFINNYAIAFNVEAQMMKQITCFPYQEELLEDFLTYKWNIILKSRQTGISVITAAYVAWKLIFGVDEKVVIIANDREGAIRFLSHVKMFLSNLPKFLHSIENEISSSATKIEVGIPGGTYKNIAIAKAASKNAGRGDSPTLLVLDEWAFAELADEIWTSAMAGLSMTKGDCIIISTPYGTGNLYHKQWVEAESTPDGEGSFKATRIHWTENPISSKGLTVSFDSKNRKVYSSPWYEEMKSKYSYDPVKIAQELDLSFTGSKLLAFDPEDIERQKSRIVNDKIEPKMYFEINETENVLTGRDTGFYIFEQPIPGRSYIIAADVAYKGTDKSTIQILDVITLEQVAEYQGKVDPDVFAFYIWKAAMYYNEAYVVVEANNHGLVTCFELRNRRAYKRLFYSKSILDIHVRAGDYIVEQGDRIPGFQTTTQTRPSVVGAISKALRESGLKLNSKRLIGELETFIVNAKKNGKQEAEKGYNDDLVIALGIALHIRETEYENVMRSKKMYGAMLDAITYSKSPLGETESPIERDMRKKELHDLEEKTKNIPFDPIFFPKQDIDDDDSDSGISWVI